MGLIKALTSATSQTFGDQFKEFVTCPQIDKNVLIQRGIVEHGKQIGRTIGFPTANLKFEEDKVIPAKGVYYTNVKWKNNIYKGITSVGSNPTVNGTKLTIETFILDFNHDIYGDDIVVYFIEKIRDEKRFDSIDCLKKQLNKDEEYAKLKELAVII